MSPSKHALLPWREGAVTVSIDARTTMRKILYFFGWENGCAGRFLWVKPTLGVDFGDVVAGTTHANVPLRRQSWERATWMSRNIDLGVNFRLRAWEWFVVRSSYFLLFLLLRTWNFYEFFLLILWREILECSPYHWKLALNLPSIWSSDEWETCSKLVVNLLT